MVSIIVTFPKIENGKAIKNYLVRSGYHVKAVCTSGAQTINALDEVDAGLVICGYKINDMLYSQLYECLPKGVEMLLIASRTKLSECYQQDILRIEMPLKVNDLVDTVEMVLRSIESKHRRQKKLPKKRNEKEQEIINKAKRILMERDNMSEEEAHRYIQKNSMDSGNSMVETAEMVIAIMAD